MPAHKKSKTYKLSWSQWKALDNLANGREIDAHISGMSESGGFSKTLESLYRYELVRLNEGTYELTDRGRQAHVDKRFRRDD